MQKWFKKQIIILTQAQCSEQLNWRSGEKKSINYNRDTYNKVWPENCMKGRCVCGMCVCEWLYNVTHTDTYKCMGEKGLWTHQTPPISDTSVQSMSKSSIWSEPKTFLYAYIIILVFLE